MKKIYCFEEDISFQLNDEAIVSDWLTRVVAEEDHHLVLLNYIWCSDEYLLKMNQEYLNHNTLTDIITFDNSDLERDIEGDVFISIDRIKENASRFNVDWITELHRVMVHGLLHLCGYADKTQNEKKIMRAKEEFYLQAFESIKPGK